MIWLNTSAKRADSTLHVFLITDCNGCLNWTFTLISSLLWYVFSYKDVIQFQYRLNVNIFLSFALVTFYYDFISCFISSVKLNKNKKEELTSNEMSHLKSIIKSKTQSIELSIEWKLSQSSNVVLMSWDTFIIVIVIT